MTRMYIKKVNGIKCVFLVDFNLLKWKRMTWFDVTEVSTDNKHWNKANPSLDFFGRHTIQA